MGSTRARRRRFKSWGLVGGAVAALMAVAAQAAESADAATVADPLVLPMEQLLQTDVVSAARFARQVTDAASAVSVLTAEDIRRYGWRTLGEVLDHMRGIYLNTASDYVYMGSRGIGGIKTMSGRLLLLIDGVVANDNFYEQTFLGYDNLIDPALIERIEYAPGAGSAMYGNNAFLGVINVVTRRGRGVDGLEAAVSVGSHADRYGRLTWGRRLEGGSEWLASLTVHRNDGTPSLDYDSDDQILPYPGRDPYYIYTGRLEGAQDAHLFVKGQMGNWGLTVLGMTRQQRIAWPWAPDWVDTDTGTDSLGVVSLAHDDTYGAGWRATQRAVLGRYQFRAASSSTFPGEDFIAFAGTDGAWWLLDSQWSYDGINGHKLVLDARMRYDTMQKLWLHTRDQALHIQTRTVSLAVEDQIDLAAGWQATLGLRAENRTRQPTTWSPRAALVYTPDARWTLKLSHGRSTRQFTLLETLRQSAALEALTWLPGEKATITEGMAEYRDGGLRLLGSLYRYRLDNPYTLERTPKRLNLRGLELEGEWLWQGWQLRGSQTWQWPAAPLGEPIYDTPHTISKLLVSAPLGSERWRLGMALRRTGGYASVADFSDDTSLVFDVPGRTVTDLTLTGLRLADQWNLTLAVRNLFNVRNSSLTLGRPTDRNSRNVWLEVSTTWR